MINKFFIIFILFDVLSAQELPFLYKVNVKCSVVYNDSSGYYFYNYTIENDQQNKGKLSSFSIDMSRDTTSLNLDTAGLIFARNYLRVNFGRRFPPLSQKIVPFSFCNFPPHWSGTLGIIPRASIFLDTLFIPPGQIVSGIRLMSRGIPSVRNATIEPFFDDVAYYGNSVPDIDAQDSINNIISYYGFVIGPQSPPINFIQTIWCDTLSSYTTQSRNLGWITTQTIANKYLNYFATAKTQLQSNKTTSARTTLQQALTDVNIDSSSTLTSEAYALLRFNTEYLISKLYKQTKLN